MPHLTLAPNETRLATVIVGGYAELSNSCPVPCDHIPMRSCQKFLNYPLFGRCPADVQVSFFTGFSARKDAQASVQVVMHPPLRFDIVVAMPVCRDLQRPSLETHAVVRAHCAFLLFAQNVRQRIAPDPGDEGAPFFSRGYGKLGIESWQTGFQKVAIRRFQRRDAQERQFPGQTPLMRGKRPFRTSPRFRRVPIVTAPVTHKASRVPHLFWRSIKPDRLLALYTGQKISLPTNKKVHD
ncbi:MAG: hypothetical protein LBQ81_02800 [Zoogloeaceae bacterium]|jgi:hypothetical protein|nr:hypothetical protein [Zoogloeaceae bacterium]